VLDVKCLSFNIELQHIGMSSIKDRIAATVYPLGTWFVLEICVWIPRVKEMMTTTMMIIIIIMCWG